MPFRLGPEGRARGSWEVAESTPLAAARRMELKGKERPDEVRVCRPVASPIYSEHHGKSSEGF